MPASNDASSKRRPLRWLVLASALLLGLWLVFFDSHSLTKRIRFHQERAALEAENDSLRRSIKAFQHKLQSPPSDSVIERIAREQYGMRRPGETVYRVEE